MHRGGGASMGKGVKTKPIGMSVTLVDLPLAVKADHVSQKPCATIIPFMKSCLLRNWLVPCLTIFARPDTGCVHESFLSFVGEEVAASASG
uniref:Uncharacterized protein n=1 Tax=Panagrellus redivivus TaxID=6233 RepID=A0A7E4ZT15_PANRE